MTGNLADGCELPSWNASLSIREAFVINTVVDRIQETQTAPSELTCMPVGGHVRKCSLIRNHATWCGGRDGLPIYIAFKCDKCLVVWIKGTRFSLIRPNDIFISLIASYPSDNPAKYSCVFTKGIAETDSWPEYPDPSKPDSLLEDIAAPVVAKRCFDRRGQVHWGYCMAAYEIITNTVLPIMGKYLEGSLVDTDGNEVGEIEDIVFVGHSLGGAVASMCGVLLKGGINVVDKKLNAYALAVAPPRCVDKKKFKGDGLDDFVYTFSNPYDIFQSDRVAKVASSVAWAYKLGYNIRYSFNSRKISIIPPDKAESDSDESSESDSDSCDKTFVGTIRMLENQIVKCQNKEYMTTVCRPLEKNDGKRIVIVRPIMASKNHKLDSYTNMFVRVEEHLMTDVDDGGLVGMDLRRCTVESVEVAAARNELRYVGFEKFNECVDGLPIVLRSEHVPFRIVLASNEGMCLQVQDNWVQKNAVCLAEIKNHTKQYFCISNGLIHVFNTKRPKVLDILGGKEAFGLPIIESSVNPDNVNASQRFKLVPADIESSAFIIHTDKYCCLSAKNDKGQGIVSDRKDAGSAHQKWKLQITEQIWDRSESIEKQFFVVPPFMAFRVLSAIDENLCFRVEIQLKRQATWVRLRHRIVLDNKDLGGRQYFYLSGGFIHVFNASSPKVLDILGGSVERGKYIHVFKKKDVDNSNQKFSIVPCDDSSGFVYIQAEGNLVLEASEHQKGAHIMTADKTDSMRQKWKLELAYGNLI